MLYLPHWTYTYKCPYADCHVGRHWHQGFFLCFLAFDFLSVLRGHSVFSSPPQRSMTSDEHYILFDFFYFELCYMYIISTTHLLWGILGHDMVMKIFMLFYFKLPFQTVGNLFEFFISTILVHKNTPHQLSTFWCYIQASSSSSSSSSSVSSSVRRRRHHIQLQWHELFFSRIVGFV